VGQRKLQVFLSSTYTDLIQYRLAAMEAIQAGGHIPAAMEQFNPGDETAWEKITRWIDNSDAYILILGGRYGSLKPKSRKSYTQLEYEYALKQKKPYMSLVIKDEALRKRVMSEGPEVKEEGNEKEYRDFKKLVTERHCGFWEDTKDIKTAILQKLPEWNERPDLKGWVRADEAASPETMNELARLSSENRDLRQQIQNSSTETFDGATFEQIVKILREDINFTSEETFEKVLGRELLNAGDFFDVLMEDLAEQRHVFNHDQFDGHVLFDKEMLRPITKHNLAVLHREVESRGLYLLYFKLTDVGRRLRNRLLLYGNREKRYRELWHVSSGEISTSGS
jgi:Domain of unknown function (DUF4062)